MSNQRYLDDALQVAHMAGIAESTFSPARWSGAARVAYVTAWNESHPEDLRFLTEPVCLPVSNMVLP